MSLAHFTMRNYYNYWTWWTVKSSVKPVVLGRACKHLRKEGQEFKIILSYIAGLWLAWAT